ncbi:hypothetical protein ACFX11_041147 [Malus domestica]
MASQPLFASGIAAEFFTTFIRLKVLQKKQIKMLMRKMRDASTSQLDLNRKTWMSSRNGEKCITSTRQQHIGAADTRTWPRETQGSSNGIQALHEVLCRGQREPSGQCQQPVGRERPEDLQNCPETLVFLRVLQETM